MKRHPTTTPAAFIFLLLAAATGGAQVMDGRVVPPPPPAPVAAQVPLDPGRVEGGVYSNDFFGFSFTLPEGWTVQDSETKKEIAEAGRSLLAEGATARKRVLTDAAMKRTYLLLSATKYDPSKGIPGFNAILMCIAERVPTAVVKSEADYVTLMLRTFNSTSSKAELLGPIRTERVGGNTFTTANFRTTVGGMVGVQRYYVKLMKGYAVTLVYTYVDEPDLKTFDDFLKTVKFK